jgi:hypothetical protein
MDEKHKKMLDMINSDSFQKALDESVSKMIKRQEIRISKIVKFYNKYDDIINELIDKVISKYNSEEYYFKETSIGYEPRTKLFWLIRDYFKEYGRECIEEEYEKYGNMFTRDMYYYKGYIAHIMDGQGSVVNIFKVEE